MATDITNRPATPTVVAGRSASGVENSDSAVEGQDTNNDGVVDSREKWDAKVDKNRRENAGAAPVFAVLKGGKDDGETSGAVTAPKGAGTENDGLREMSFAWKGVPRGVEQELINAALTGSQPSPETNDLVHLYYIEPAVSRVGDFVAKLLAERGLPATLPPSLEGRRAA